MSVWKAIKSGHFITFSPNGSSPTTKDGRIFDIIEKNKLFYLRRDKLNKNSKIEKLNKIHLGEAKHTLEEWHKILGHCNVADVQKLEATVDGMHILSKEKFSCTTCVLGKMTV